MRRGNLLTLSLLTSLCAGCGGGGGSSTPPPQSPTITSVSASCTPASITTAQTSTCSATVTGTGSYSSGVTWTATGGAISSAGVFTPSATGTATITATSTEDSTKSGPASVTVTAVPITVTSVTVIASPGTITTSQTSTCTATVSGTGAYSSAVTWTATGGTITSGGVFTPSGAGTASCTANSAQTGYTSVSGSANITVNPGTPTISTFTPRYTTCDTQCNFVNYVITGLGFENGDIVHDPSGLFPNDITLVLASGATNFGITYQWQLPGSFQPWFETIEMQHPGGSYGNQASIAFLGSANQSTLVVSATTGTLFQAEQKSGQVYWQKTDGTTGKFFPSGVTGSSSDQIAVDDVTGKVVYLIMAATNVSSPQIDVYDESGNGGCYVNATGMSFVSSIAAKGGYMVFTDPVENLVGIAKMDCTGYTTISIAGQPWSVAMTNNGNDLVADVFSRDDAGNKTPRVTKISIPSGTTEGFVDLTGIPTVTSIRATAPYAGVYQVQAFSLSATAAVLFMSDQTDGKVLIINTNTSSGAKMGITYTTPVTDLPIGITAQESTSSSTLWVSYIAAGTMDAVTHIGAINPTTGNYTPAIGAFPAGTLAGGVVGTKNGVIGAMGSTITAPLVLQP